MTTHNLTHSRTRSVPYDPRCKAREDPRTLIRAKSTEMFSVHKSLMKRTRSLTSVLAGMDSDIQLLGVRRIQSRAGMQVSTNSKYLNLFCFIFQWS